MSQFQADGRVSIRLRGGGKTFAPGELPAGSYEILADLGDGSMAQGTATCPANGRCVVRCNSLLGRCTAEASP